MTITLKPTFHGSTGNGALLALLLAACGSSGAHEEPQPNPDDQHHAPDIVIRYTEYGIPHVRAANYRELGFGQGYAQARDNLCKIERGMLEFKGEASRHFGADGSPNSMTMASPSSLVSDLYFKGIVRSGVIEELLAQPAPLGPNAHVREAVQGYVAGFNALLAEHPDVECRGADWVVPMTEMDVYRRVYAVTTLMDQTALHAPGIVTAVPPSPGGGGTRSPTASEQAQLRSEGPEQPSLTAGVPVARSARPGSNGIALGGDITETGGGINLANPHLRWSSDMRWSVGQLTIPGKLDVSGASLIGVPFVVMGHTEAVAWSITTAEPTRHHVLYELTLADDSPTTYLIDGKREAMRSIDVTVEIKQPDGSIEEVNTTQWLTRFGAVQGPGSILSLPAWSAASGEGPGHAYVVADANTRNMRMLNTLYAFNHAQSSHQILDAIRETQGVPWWSVLAADADGQALLSQIQVVPKVTDDMLEACSTELGKILFASDRFALLDGSRSECLPGTDDDALQPGTFGPGDDESPRLPFVLTRDYAENSNDSYWLPSASLRIEGMPLLVGQEGSPRDLRTRGLISELEAHKAVAPFTRETLADMMLSNRSYTADLVLDDSVALCRALPNGTATASDGNIVDVRASCDTLADFNHVMDTDNPGALLFSRFWAEATKAAEAAALSLWKTPFDSADPVNTPRTLDADNPVIARALADVVQNLQTADIPLDATLADYQYVIRNGERFAIGGGADELAVVNVVVTDEPGSDPRNASGYMHVVAFNDTSCPEAVTLLSYSQSSDPNSPHYSDQTALFSQGQWVTSRFCDPDIDAATVETIKLSSSR
jgi:acyl-homoserine-lactone acylase